MSAGIVDVARELVLNLREQTRVWSRLLELSIAQRAALEVQDVHAVHALLQEIEVAMHERQRTELRRSILVRQAAAHLGIEPDDVTRDLIAGCCDSQLASELVEAAEQLREVAGELDVVAKRNAMLLEQELSIIEVLVQGVTTDASARTTYGKQGVQEEAPRLRLLDAQA